MASIQQSLNQLLGAFAGAVTAGSYMFRQSPGYKKNQEIKSLKSDIENINAAQEKLGELAADTKDKYDGDFKKTPAYKAADELQPNLYQKRQRLLQLDWEENTAKLLANDRAALDDINRKLKKEAEDKGLNRIMDTIETQNTQQEMLNKRKETLKGGIM